ncbi:hypothetical protein ncot_13305 [Nocardioides sp. JQ2195]|uniref:hypothetical protein n=1 Tax=Nocardioides sp. JQ2195 TaxID=2592334 RepID=UPI00143E7A27|nr:hypothetical protein [Nocardioides sp. JQ2195]QIX27476.1 hypothetical protein ncot_13305 [Nocardioides sp. JQ2195]
MSTPVETPIPALLKVAVGLAALESLGLVTYAMLELFHLSGGRLVMGLSTALFFAAYGGFLAWATWSMRAGESWARSPVVFTQLMALGLAWSFRGGETTAVAIGLAVVAVVVLGGVLNPASMDYLSDEGTVDPS